MDELSFRCEKILYFFLENICVSFLFIFLNVLILIKYLNYIIYLRYKLVDFFLRFDKLKMNFM